ncbi:MAG: ROK family protein [Candidatus Desulforudis sp.]|nr:ROK family protein [Desulforudis sp.]
MAGYVVGIDLGGTKIYTVLAAADGEIAAEVEVPTGAEQGYERVLDRIAETVFAVCSRAGVGPGAVSAVGVGAPGPLDPGNGVIHQAPNLGWRKVPFRDDLGARLRFPVYLENDANLGALGEHTYGAGRGSSEMMYVTVSTGVGGGLILRGEIYGGAGGGAGEIGHITVVPRGPRCGCGGRGCLEAVASGTAIARRAQELITRGAGTEILTRAGGEAGAVTAATVAGAAGAGDPEARAILEEAAVHLGTGLAAVVNLLNPDLIVLGGGVMKHNWALLWDRLDLSLREQALEAAYRRVRLAPAALGDRVGGLGAVALALRGIGLRPGG